MLKQNRVSILLAAAALIVVPAFMSMPANAQTKPLLVADRQDWNRDRDNRSNYQDRDRDGRRNYREDRDSGDRGNWNRDNDRYGRAVRLRNGDIRYPNGQLVPARRIVRLRNQGYYRLPNGDILRPNQEIVPVGRLERVRDGYFRLPDGVVVQINL
ncbi:hypothetical protein WKK05_24875 [Nostoc sp. UHCC 0302]|uniref:hypothetical protein n=1 Tax=Nostoc sp. UHCC 0302 TaxID=3134896 RepID=UPI00311CB642